MKEKVFNFKQYVLNESKLDDSCPLATRDIVENTKKQRFSYKI